MDCVRGIWGHFEILHALKCVLGASEVLFAHVYSTYIPASCRLCLTVSDRKVPHTGPQPVPAQGSHNLKLVKVQSKKQADLISTIWWNKRHIDWFRFEGWFCLHYNIEPCRTVLAHQTRSFCASQRKQLYWWKSLWQLWGKIFPIYVHALTGEQTQCDILNRIQDSDNLSVLQEDICVLKWTGVGNWCIVRTQLLAICNSIINNNMSLYRGIWSKMDELTAKMLFSGCTQPYIKTWVESLLFASFAS